MRCESVANRARASTPRRPATPQHTRPGRGFSTQPCATGPRDLRMGNEEIRTDNCTTSRPAACHCLAVDGHVVCTAACCIHSCSAFAHAAVHSLPIRPDWAAPPARAPTHISAGRRVIDGCPGTADRPNRRVPLICCQWFQPMAGGAGSAQVSLRLIRQPVPGWTWCPHRKTQRVQVLRGGAVRGARTGHRPPHVRKRTRLLPSRGRQQNTSRAQWG